jgi:iron complex outermembrane receptor protein
MPMSNQVKSGLIALGIVSASAATAYADTVDYRSLRELFGESVTLSATGSPMRASEAPGTMVILTAEDIRRTGATTIPEALRNVPGIQVNEWTLGYSDVAVRSHNQAFSSRLLVLINGRQVFQSFWSMTQWRQLPVQMGEIEQIEIVKGPNTALFGFNAVGGVINIITKSPMDKSQAEATVRYGTQDFFQASGVGSYTDGKFGFRASAGYQHFGEYDTPRNAPLGPPAYDFGHDGEVSTLLSDMSYNLDARNTVGWENSYYKATYVQQWPTYFQSLLPYEGYSSRLYYNGDTAWGLLSAQAYINGLNDPESNELYVVQAQDIFKIGTEHTVRVSAEYRRNSMDANDFYTGANLGDLVQEDWAVGGMWSWAIDPRLSWTNAVRVDFWSLERDGPLGPANPFSLTDFNQDRTELSVNSGLVYRPTEIDTWRLSFGRGVQTPNLIESGALDLTQPIPVGPFPTAYIGGNPFLKTQVVQNYEAGYQRKVEDIGGKIGVNAFYQTNSNLVGMQQSVSFQPQLSFTSLIETWTNIGDSDMYGLELTADGTIGTNWNWDAGYTFTTVNDDLRNGGAGGLYTVYAEYEKSNPDHMLNLHLGYTEGPWQADLYGVAWSSHQSLRSVPTGVPGVALLVLTDVPAAFDPSARIAYNFDNFTLALEGQHLARDQLTVTSAPDVERRVMLSLTGRLQ